MKLEDWFRGVLRNRENMWGQDIEEIRKGMQRRDERRKQQEADRSQPGSRYQEPRL